MYRPPTVVRPDPPSISAILGADTFTTENLHTVSFQIHLEVEASDKYRISIKRVNGSEAIVALGEATNLRIQGPLGDEQ